MLRLLFLISLLLHVNAYSQIDSKKVDSLARVIDSSARAQRKQQETIIKHTDNDYKSELNKALQQNSANRNAFLQQKSEQRRKRQQVIISVLVGVILLLMVVITLVPGKKKSS